MSEPTADPSSPAFSGASTASPLRTAARPAAEFKGLSHPALRLMLNEPDDAAIAAALDALLGDDEDAFEWQPVVVDAARIGTAESVDVGAVVARLRASHLHPVALAGAHGALRGEAERLQLGWLAALPERRGRAAEAAAEAADVPGAAPASSAAAAPAAAAAETSAAAPAQAEPAADAPPAAAPAATQAAMVIERPVRSGQQVYARERDLIVIGDVSPGAEVIADGHVHVYGTLGGRAIAGARGRRDAGIFTLGLRAELVAVSGIYRTFEDGVPAQHAGKPVRISLEADADTLSMRPL
ncbi:MAG: septum site-determining protein MinC [Burkholderiales bacterium]|nr:MAG: septum site-determining protein MinC [Burkholderiales bacterium]